MWTREAEHLAGVLSQRATRLVLAESCTAGMGAALLAAIPGISAYLCGSFVTYREECKQAWLGVPAELLSRYSAVSPEVTEVMAIEALRRTPSATCAAAITGHLGPDAPASADGICFLACARNDRNPPRVERLRFALAARNRIERQREAAQALLAFVADVLTSVPNG